MEYYTPKIKTLHRNKHPNKHATVEIKKHAPLPGNYLKNVVYRAYVKTNNSVKQYEGEFIFKGCS